MSKNKNLGTAKKEKKDEFYTQLTDIQKELGYYIPQFKDKIVYCNCDDPFESNFFKFFTMRFNLLGLKKLIATCYIGSPISNTELSLYDYESTDNKTTKVPHKIIINEFTDENSDGIEDLQDIIISLAKNKNNTLTRLKGDGDFRSEECIELLKEADIVCTNPPFSLFREYVAQLVEYNKQFLVIGNKNAITYKETFKLIKENKLRLGYKSPEEFTTPEGVITRNVIGLCRWFTNLYVKKYEEDMSLYKNYNPEEYPKYDNYDAIEVSKVNEIPKDYDGIMGVPVTFLDKWNPKQFEILGSADDKDWYEPVFGYYKGRITLDGASPFKRIFIRRVGE